MAANGMRTYFMMLAYADHARVTCYQSPCCDISLYFFGSWQHDGSRARRPLIVRYLRAAEAKAIHFERHCLPIKWPHIRYRQFNCGLMAWLWYYFIWENSQRPLWRRQAVALHISSVLFMASRLHLTVDARRKLTLRNIILVVDTSDNRPGRQACKAWWAISLSDTF